MTLIGAHRVAVGALATKARDSAVDLFDVVLDPDSLDASAAAWASQTASALRGASSGVDREASEYLGAWGREHGRAMGFARPALADSSLDRQLMLSGPIRIKTLVGNGVDRSVAVADARRRVGATAMKSVRDRDRLDVIYSCRKQRVRCRRVTVGKTCAFCCMLAARGPVYTKDSAAFQAHVYCDCTYEPVDVPNAKWKASEASDHDLELVDLYDEAVASQKAAGTSGLSDLLARMRRSGNGLLSDGVS